jgi:hypothetical protein
MSKKKHKQKSDAKSKSKAKRRIQLELSKGKDDELLDWARKTSVDQSLPDGVQDFLAHLSEVLQSGENTKDQLENIRKALAISMRIIPSSERISNAPLNPAATDEEIAAIDQKILEANRIARYAGQKAKALRKRRDDLLKLRSEQRAERHPEGAQGDSQDDPEPQQGENEGVFSASPVLDRSDLCDLFPTVSKEQQTGLIMNTIDRRREDVAFVKSSLTFTGQEFFNPVTGEKFGYDFSLVGPPGSNFTYRSFVFLTLQVVGLGMPIARVERMLRGGSFSRQAIHRILGHVADHMAPIYLQLIDELSEASVIGVDDTHTRVNEINQYFKRPGKKQPPWERFEESKVLPEEKNGCSSDSPEQTSRCIAAGLAKELTYAFDQVRSPEIKKTQHLTTCAHGIVGSSGTRIVIYRSHLGSAGNFLDQLLSKRSVQNKEVVIVADLSSSNKVRDPEVIRKISIHYAGCAAHARRPFFRHIRDDLDPCLEILDYFKFIFEVESIVKKDSPKDKVLWRNSKAGSVEIWHDLKASCEEMTKKFSSATPLGDAARYVLRNFEALTFYLNRGDLPADNNLTERLLRFEKLAERNTYGSKTIEGRARMDILRSVITTARYSGLDESLYLLKVLTVPLEQIKSAPEQYTPYAVQKHFEKDPDDKEHINSLLHATDYSPFVKRVSSFDKNPAK